MENKKFNPMILQTKEELEIALKQGKLKTAKYNLLSDSEKRFVELVCFGGYTGEQAVRAINPGTKNPYAIANQVMANQDVKETIEELTLARDMKFKSEIVSARDMALSKVQYIMMTTKDETLAASCAKIILDKAEAAVKDSAKKPEEPVGQVKFNIQVENVYNGGASPKVNDPVIIELTDEEINPEEVKEKTAKAAVDPDTGLSYTLHYQS